MASNRREFFLEADKRGPVRRFWDDQIMWRANALYHNDALNLPVKMLTGSRMDDPVTPGRMAEAALALSPLGMFGRARTAMRTVGAAKAARMTVEEAQAVGRTLSPEAQSYYFHELGKHMPTTSTVMYPIAKNSAVRRAVGGVRQAYKAAGAVGATVRGLWELGKGALKLNQAAGRAVVKTAAKLTVGGVERGTAGLAKIGWGTADFAASPFGLYWGYRYLKKPGEQKEMDDKAIAENKDAEKANQEIAEVANALAARSDARVLRDLLARRLGVYEKDNMARLNTASQRVANARQKGQHPSQEELNRQVSDALAAVDAENQARLLDGLDRESEGWKDLRKQRETELMASAQDEFIRRTNGLNYAAALEKYQGGDTNTFTRMKAFEKEVLDRIPTNAVDEIRFMAGGGYGR